ncbi:MAG TPA: hypothetical protein VE981_20905 [Planctomycetota bacterium]|nr:hypothetical protein [Planctomycetota bacterium]
MKFCLPAILLLGACAAPSTDPAALTRELADLRAEIAELRKVREPAFDSAQAMEDLSKEVRRLREQQARTPPPPPAVTLPVATPAAGGFYGGVGGTLPNVNDLLWVLSRVSVDGQERLVLALYKAKAGGNGFGLSGVRILGGDLQIVEFNQERPHVKDVLEALKRK